MDHSYVPEDVHKSENVQFLDAESGAADSRGTVTDRLRDDPLLDDAGLSDFFSRPIRIATYDWSPSVQIFQKFNPWVLYWQNPRVINRIANYKLLKSTLKVKLVINGNPFYYGRLICSYNPRHTVDDLTVDRGFFIEDIVAASQRPHVYLNPTTSSGGELELPFFTEQNSLDIATADWSGMGECTLATLNNLIHANGSSASLTVSVFAWAENVSYAVPTQFTPASLSNQSHTELVNQAGDEYAQGKLSGPATTLAKVASWFKDVPMIGSYAKATEIAASTFAKTADLFGYSKPVELDKGYYEPMTKSSLCTTNERDTTTKLSLDAKQELTIDPKIAGINTEDELSILSIATKESFLTNFNWNLTATEESRIFTMAVDPALFVRRGSELHFPASCFAVMPFKHWKGSMRIRFQVVCSGYHRGRLKIVYDPTGSQSSAEYNTAYTTVVDITEESDFTIDCGWGQRTSWATHASLDTAQGQMFKTDTTLSAPNFGNGTLSVYVVNKLTAPHETFQANAQVNVFISALEDFEVANPTNDTVGRLRLVDDLGNQAYTEDLPHPTESVAVTDPPNVATMAAPTVVSPQLNLIHYGEVIGSFRQVLKRYNYHETLFVQQRSTNHHHMYFREQFPHQTGYVSNSYPEDPPVYSVNADANRYVYGGMPLIQYVSYAFGGRRGGIRYCLEALNLAGKMSDNTMTVSRTTFSDVTDTVTTSTNAPRTLLSSLSDMYNFNDSDGQAGLAKWAPSVNKLFSFELPYYSRFRFEPAKKLTDFTQKAETNGWTLSFEDRNSLATDIGLINSYVAAAEDFTCVFYLGPPIFYDSGLASPTS